MTTSRRAAIGRIGLLAAGAGVLAGMPAQAASATAAGDRVDVTFYGAATDESADAAPAIRQAIAAVAARRTHGGIVWFPAGSYVLRSALVVPKNVILAGESPIAARLRYAGDPTEAFVTFGTTSAATTFSGVRGLWLNAAGRAETTVLLHAPQEGSSIEDAICEGATRSVVEVRSDGVEGGSNKFTIQRSWLWSVGDAAVAGVRIAAGGGPLSIRDTTIAGVGRSKAAPAGSGGVVAVQSIITLDNVNVERFESHTALDRTQAEIRGATGFFNPYGVRTSAASTAQSLDVVNSDFDGTRQCIVDRGSGVTIRFCRSYSNEAYRHDRRHFRRNHWELGSANVYQSEQAQVTMGFTSPATADTSTFKFTTLLRGGWRRSAQIDRQGRFGTASSAFDGAHLRLGDYHVWVDAKGRLRIKKGAPTRDRDGRVVGR